VLVVGPPGLILKLSPNHVHPELIVLVQLREDIPLPSYCLPVGPQALLTWQELTRDGSFVDLNRSSVFLLKVKKNENGPGKQTGTESAQWHSPRIGEHPNV